jgi:hypothetical protein
LVDPWAPRAVLLPTPGTGWVAPDIDVLLDPWQQQRSVPVLDLVIIDPWADWFPDVPGAAFLSEPVVDPWQPRPGGSETLH